MLAWDTQALFWINGHHNPILDGVLYPVSLAGEKGLLVALLIVGVFVGMPRRDWPVWAGIGLALIIADRLLVDGLMLAWWRERPFLALEGVRQVGPLWYSSSFPSGHAQYAWLVTILFGARRRAFLWAFLPYTLMTCYSRPYFGMHYPSDVLSGSFFGIAFGVLVVCIQRAWIRRIARLDTSNIPGAPLGAGSEKAVR